MNRSITATILIIIAVGIYFTVTEDMLAGVKDVQAVNDNYVSAINNAEKLIKVRDNVLKDYSNISQENRARLDKMLPTNVDNIRLIIDLNSIATRSGFSLKGIKAVVAGQDVKGSSKSTVSQSTDIGGGAVDPNTAMTTIPVPALDTVTVSFSVSATYSQFIGLMQELEANLRIMDITRYTTTANDNGVYDWNVELKTYWLKS